MKMLHISSSPREQRSASLDIAHAFIENWLAEHPDGTVDTLDVWTTRLPAFDGAALDAKYAGLTGRALTESQQAAWAEIRQLADRLTHADLLLLSVPMWNFGIPYQLKQLIDAVSQKDMLFTVDGFSLRGLLGGKRAVVIAARGVKLGGDYPEKDYDYQVAYLRTWCGMIGITDFQSVLIEGTLGGPEADEAARGVARLQAVGLARADARHDARLLVPAL